MSERRIESVRIAWLEAFLMVAKYQSYSAAALQLGCDQSTVSRYVAQLQIWLRRDLLTGYVPTVLTPDGEVFFPKAVEICRLLDESRAPKRPRISAKDIVLKEPDRPAD